MVGLYIVGVRYSGDETPAIERVKVRYLVKTNNGGFQLTNPHELSVSDVRGILRAGYIGIRTATRDSDGKWDLGKADVVLYGDRYLTTSANAVERDNLGKLPEF